ncbi:hypothetical protein LYSHEL_00200 [Lysobacter helvus]|uniref:SGNH hydrolase-type esterase domain-containing protein n=2 Tax=Lysobacteraceae TaxID=32033 RepID=A0ABM7Q1A1_9GAMM|nr:MULTISPECIES: hypothetical protein [Lysobacter]BCT90996.1 hypothetical protein LYSCAS_00200 [Lysobacter caseinilyticus]BCT94149.1 hypothetical protein LYSHEL_00200 [Lysobacter helvus]
MAKGPRKSVGRKSARKAAPKKAARKTPAKKVAKSVASGPPLTLEEAQALARARRPVRTTRRALAAATTTPAAVGAERKRLQQSHDEERARRLQEYEDTMALLKQRGVRRTTTARKTTKATKARRTLAKNAGGSASFKPLQVLAEGDSWFDYPIPLFGGGIIPRLQKRLGVPILNMADAGDEVRFMLGVAQRKRMVQMLLNGCPAGGPWDVLLFSGGGNDIVDNPMALWVRNFTAGGSAASQLHQPRFDTALALVRAGYEDLIELRDGLSPTTHLVFHGYDFAIPDGRGVCNYGPWLKPTFDLRGFPSQAAGQAVVKVMLQQFQAMLTQLAGAHPKVTCVATQGTLAPQASSWHNELHPAKTGFETFATKFQQHLKTLFPTRVQ